MEKRNVWQKYTGDKRELISIFGEEYKQFLSVCKTERECVAWFKEKAQQFGYVSLNQMIEEKRQIKSGDKIYVDNMGKAIALFHIGAEDMERGLAILGAHIDSPRLDLKQNPLYEDTDLALLDTHYYGGIKKYQWVTLPLALRGILVKKDGSTVRISIGDQEDDPVFGVSDLLVHLASEQMEKKAVKVIEGENLDILIGSAPLLNEEAEVKAKDAVKANVLNILKEQYNIEEEDFLSAEIEVVPAGKARDYGFDRSMIMGYGHDDRACAFASFEAMLQIDTGKKTRVCLLVDKEEVGSSGASSMHSKFFEYALIEIMSAMGCYSQISFNRMMNRSKMLSSDVSAAFDPLYPLVNDKKNAAYFNKGLVFNKYTGARGKANCNDANPEFMAELRNIMEKHDICFQTAELGKVDQGGGGTIAYILANYNMQVIDCGVPVLNMHAPWEIISKADLLETKKGYEAFLEEA